MSSQRFTPDIIARAEKVVSHIQGISSCRITTDETGEITEVHVVATVQKPQKFIARDVETCLKAEMGIEIDHRKIGVAIKDVNQPLVADPDPKDENVGQLVPVPEDVEEFPLEEISSRLSFRSVNLFITQENVKAEVELLHDGVDTFGNAKSKNPARPQIDIIAEATLNAVSEILDEGPKLCLFEAKNVKLGEEDAIIVRVGLSEDREMKSLAGCCIVTGDLNRTAVYATLDAVNRILGKLRTKASIEYKIE